MRRLILVTVGILALLAFSCSTGSGGNDEIDTYAITITPTGAASGESVTANVTEAAEGATITLTASLGAGRQVSLNAEGVVITPSTITTNDEPATFTMPGAAVVIAATFSDIPPTVHTITITPTGGEAGEMVTADVTEALEGTTVTLTVSLKLTASLGTNRQVALSAEGVELTPAVISTNGATVSFIMPDAAVSIVAKFSLQSGFSKGITVNSKSITMHYVPAIGTFKMGEHVQTTTQTVTLTKDFWMGGTEVTQNLWEAMWGTTWPGTADSRVPSSEYGLGEYRPAYYVNWYDAVAFCNLLTVADDNCTDSDQVYYSDTGLSVAYTKTNAADGDAAYVDWSKKGYRLPTEAEWEYAARFIDGTNWNHGNHVSGDTDYACFDDAKCSHSLAGNSRVSDYAWWGDNNGASGSSTYGSKDVGQKTANALGLQDMSGSVYEWCNDWYYDTYSGGAVTDPTGPDSGDFRLYRGGSWPNTSKFLQNGSRTPSPPAI